MSSTKSHKKAIVKKESYVEFIRDSDKRNKEASPLSNDHHKKKKSKTSSSCIIVIPPPENGILFNEIRSSYFNDFHHSSNILTIIGMKINSSYHTNTSSRFNRKSSNSIPSTRSNSTPLGHHLHPSIIQEDDPLSAYNRCFVEDFMMLEFGQSVVLLIPVNSHNDNIEYISMINTLQPEEYKFYNSTRATKYYIFFGDVYKNPSLDSVANGIELRDLKDGFGHQNDGVYINLQNTNSESCNFTHRTIVKWIDVLNGRCNGLQIWSKLPSIVTLIPFFKITLQMNQIY